MWRISTEDYTAEHQRHTMHGGYVYGEVFEKPFLEACSSLIRELMLTRGSLQVKQTGDSTVGVHSAFISSCSFLRGGGGALTLCARGLVPLFSKRRMAPFITSWDSYKSLKGFTLNPWLPLFLSLSVSPGGGRYGVVKMRCIFIWDL